MDASCSRRETLAQGIPLFHILRANSKHFFQTHAHKHTMNKWDFETRFEAKRKGGDMVYHLGARLAGGGRDLPDGRRRGVHISPPPGMSQREFGERLAALLQARAKDRTAPLDVDIVSDAIVDATRECSICCRGGKHVQLACGHQFCRGCMEEFYPISKRCPLWKCKT
jgi:hypothetical protein